MVAGADRPHLHLGRGSDCGLAVEGQFTSRQHASVEYRHQRFHLRDDSTNGTVVVPDGGEPVRLHREEVTLAGAGRIALGATLEEDPAAVLRYRCA